MTISGVISGVMGLLLYGLPTLIALCRGHHQRWAILALNLLLGWTLLGWIIALVWALTAKRESGGEPA